MWSADVLVWHDSGEGGHYCATTVAHVWQQIPQVILRYPYTSMDYQHDLDMTMPPWEECDQMFVFVLCFVILIASIWLYMCIWMLTVSLVLFCRCGTLRLRGIDGRGSDSLGTSATFTCRDEGGREAETRWRWCWTSTWAVGRGRRDARGSASLLQSGVAGHTSRNMGPYIGRGVPRVVNGCTSRVAYSDSPSGNSTTSDD